MSPIHAERSIDAPQSSPSFFGKIFTKLRCISTDIVTAIGLTLGTAGSANAAPPERLPTAPTEIGAEPDKKEVALGRKALREFLNKEDPTLIAKLERFFANIDNDNFLVREQAQTKLELLCNSNAMRLHPSPVVQPYIIDSNVMCRSPEQQSRIQTLIERSEEQPSRLPPGLRLPAPQMIALLRDWTGNAIRVQGQLPQKNIEVGRANTFFDILADVCDASGYTWDVAQDGAIVLSPTQGTARRALRPLSVSGPFALFLMMGKDDADPGTRSYMLLAEPRVSVLRLLCTMKGGATGAHVTAFPQPANWKHSYQNSMSQQLSVKAGQGEPLAANRELAVKLVRTTKQCSVHVPVDEKETTPAGSQRIRAWTTGRMLSVEVRAWKDIDWSASPWSFDNIAWLAAQQCKVSAFDGDGKISLDLGKATYSICERTVVMQVPLPDNRSPSLLKVTAPGDIYDPRDKQAPEQLRFTIPDRK